MPHQFLIFSQSDYLIETVQVQISWLLQNLIWICTWSKQCRSRSVGFWRSQLIWIYTICKGRAYPGSARLGLQTQWHSCNLIWYYQICTAFLTPPQKNWIHTVCKMEHNFSIYLSVNFMCGIRPPCRTAVCYQSMCHIVGELGSPAAWHFLNTQEGQVNSPQEKSQIFFINFLCYIINMEQPYSYVLYKTKKNCNRGTTLELSVQTTTWGWN